MTIGEANWTVAGPRGYGSVLSVRGETTVYQEMYVSGYMYACIKPSKVFFIPCCTRYTFRNILVIALCSGGVLFPSKKRKKWKGIANADIILSTGLTVCP